MRLGVSGHRDLGGPAGQAWVLETLSSLIRELQPTLGLSSLAGGADQLFASEILRAEIPLVALLPCREYRSTFDSIGAAEFDRLLGAAVKVRRLPFGAPTEEAYHQAGRALVNRCQTLIAVWDGEKPRGLGGTGDAVKQAARLGKRIIHLDPFRCNVVRDLPKENAMRHARIFVSFAIEDQRYRDLLKGQSLHEDCPFEFTDMSVKEPWDSEWKTRCRSRVRGCDGVIALLSAHTARADGALWEMRCAREEGIPLLGVHIHSDHRGAVPSGLAGARIIDWGWDGIHSFIRECIPRMA